MLDKKARLDRLNVTLGAFWSPILVQTVVASFDLARNDIHQLHAAAHNCLCKVYKWVDGDWCVSGMLLRGLLRRREVEGGVHIHRSITENSIAAVVANTEAPLVLVSPHMPIARRNDVVGRADDDTSLVL